MPIDRLPPKLPPAPTSAADETTDPGSAAPAENEVALATTAPLDTAEVARAAGVFTVDRRRQAPEMSPAEIADWKQLAAGSLDPWSNDDSTLDVWPHPDLRTADTCRHLTLVSWAMIPGSPVDSAARVLRGCQPDVICLRATNAEIVRALADELTMHAAFTRLSGHAILSTHTIALAEEIPFDREAADGKKTSSAILRATLQAGKNRVDVVDAHVRDCGPSALIQISLVLARDMVLRGKSRRTTLLACDFLSTAKGPRPRPRADLPERLLTARDELLALMHGLTRVTEPDLASADPSRIVATRNVHVQPLKPTVGVRKDDRPLVIAQIDFP